jgi:hypothetical protein
VRSLLYWSVPVLLMTACSGSNPESAPKTTPSSTSSVVESTVAATTTTVTPTTIAPTTTLAKPTMESLFFMMPGPGDLPTGWTTAGGMPSGAIEPAEGPGRGNCGGPNLDRRATDAGVLAVMASPELLTADGGSVGFTIYAFPSNDAATKVMNTTVSQVQCPFFEYELPEGTGAGFFDGFGDDFGEGRATWTIRDSLSVGGVDIAGAADAFHLKLESEYLTDYRGMAYGYRATVVSLYEQHDRFVFVSSLSGECCPYGFSNSAATVTFTPTLESLSAGLEVIRPKILERLREAQLL